MYTAWFLGSFDEGTCLASTEESDQCTYCNRGSVFRIKSYAQGANRIPLGARRGIWKTYPQCKIYEILSSLIFVFVSQSDILLVADMVLLSGISMSRW